MEFMDIFMDINFNQLLDITIWLFNIATENHHF